MGLRMSDEKSTEDEIKAGLDVPVSAWSELQIVTANLAQSRNWYDSLKEKLAAQLLREPVNLAEIANTRAMISSRLNNHRQLMQRFYTASSQLAEKLEGAQL